MGRRLAVESWEPLLTLLRCVCCGGESGDLHRASDHVKWSCASCDWTYAVRGQVLEACPPSQGCALGTPTEEADWNRRLQLHHRWWTRERMRGPVRPATDPWRPSPSFLEHYLRLGSDPVAPDLLLDIGCADAARAQHFRQRTYVGLDPLDLPRKADVPFVHGVGEALPFAAGTFGTALMVEVLDHTARPRRCLEEALRVLSPGGALCIFSGRPEGALRTDGRSDWDVREDEVHLRGFDVHELARTLRSGFESVEILNEGPYTGVFAWGSEKPVERSA